MREEIEAHIAMRAEHDGTNSADARKRLGNALQTQEDMRRVWVPAFWDALVQDVAFTVRSLSRSPVFAVTAILVMAVGLGAASALFSALDRILFRDLPYPASEQLVTVGITVPIADEELLLDGHYQSLWRPAPEPFSSITATSQAIVPCDLTEAEPLRLRCISVETNFLQVLGLRVAAGRDFLPEDDIPGTPSVALISHDLWNSRFSADPAVIGQTVRIDGHPQRVIGVLPPDFELPTLAQADILFPLQLRPLETGGAISRTRILRAYGRLLPDVTPAQALVRTQPIFDAMLELIPERFRPETAMTVQSLHERQMGPSQRIAWLLLCAVGALLLIAGINVANLLLARTAVRQREFTVRAALGAGSGRLFRLALVEGLVISLAGCLLGLAFGAILLDVFASIAPQSIPKIGQAAIDLRVAAAAAAFSLLAGLLIALWPGVSAIQSSLLTGTRSVGAIRPWVRFSLVAAQIAVTVGLLTGSGLLLRSLERLTAANVGFTRDNVLVAPLTLGAERYPTPETRQAFLESLLQRTRRLPGVVAASVSDSVPPEAATDHMVYTNIRVEGRAVEEEGSGGVIAWRSATPGYFETLGIPVVRGRSFEERDVSGSQPAAIINDALVRRMFPNEEPLGQRIGPGLTGQDWYTVVGVVPDTHDAGASADPEPRYVLARRAGTAPALRTAYLTIRTSADAAMTQAFVREAIQQADTQLPFRIQTMEQRFSDLVERPRFVTWLLASFALIATLLAAAGLYGVVSYIVAERRRSIGVRIALGATPGRIVGDTVREVLRWTAAGALLGLVFAYGGSRLLEAQLYEIGAIDPAAWLGSLAVLSLAIAAAVLRPALSASRVDPAQTLRDE